MIGKKTRPDLPWQNEDQGLGSTGAALVQDWEEQSIYEIETVMVPQRKGDIGRKIKGNKMKNK